MEQIARNPFREPERGRKKDVFVSTDVYPYLEQTGRAELCKTIFDCKKWDVEPVLIEDLQRATDPEERDKLRGLIRALSNFPPDRRSNEEILSAFPTEMRLRNEEWQRIEQVLQSGDVGETIEETVAVIESRYNALLHRWHIAHEAHVKETLANEIERLRPIRDRLYLRRVHPEFAQKLFTTERRLVYDPKKGHAA
ncbi:MAG: hypothetical protein WC787_02580 [Patescibacteria group bacterium]|jgi:uncharacterized protein YrzB (UPF0473 family)